MKPTPVFHAGPQGDKENDVAEGHYGNLPLNQSQEKIERKIHKICELTPDLAGQKVWVRARLHTSRAKGRWLLVLLEKFGTASSGP